MKETVLGMVYDKGRLIVSYTMLITAAVIFGSLFSVNKWAAMSGVLRSDQATLTFFLRRRKGTDKNPISRCPLRRDPGDGE